MRPFILLAIAVAATAILWPAVLALPAQTAAVQPAGEYIVTLSGGVSASRTADGGLPAIAGVSVLSADGDPLRAIGRVLVRTASSAATTALTRSPAVAAIETNGVMRLPRPVPFLLSSRFLANVVWDPWVGSQWQLARVDAPGAWPRTQGAGQVVAVVDTGIDCTHPDLAANILPGYDALAQRAGCPSDDSGHGTHVSGAAAAAMNGVQGAGVAPAARILPVRVLDAAGSGTMASVARGIVWATDHGATVMNMSLGSPQDSATVHDAVKRAKAAGITIVVAAGNEGSTRVGYPAMYPEVITVGATDQSDHRPAWSNYGATYVNVGAPGVDTLATTVGGGAGYMSGTSMAAPLVAGVAALLRSVGVAPSAILTVLQRTADPCIGCQFGGGRVDAGAAVASVPVTAPTATARPPTTVPPTVAPTAVPGVATPTAGAVYQLPRGCWRIQEVACP